MAPKSELHMFSIGLHQLTLDILTFRSSLLRNPPPCNDADAALANVALRGELCDAVLPVHIDVPSKRVHAAVWLREAADHRAALGVLEGNVPAEAKGGCDGAVLVAARREGCAVVVEGLPLGRIPVPVETGRLHLHLEVFCHLIDLLDPRCRQK